MSGNWGQIFVLTPDTQKLVNEHKQDDDSFPGKLVDDLLLNSIKTIHGSGFKEDELLDFIRGTDHYTKLKENLVNYLNTGKQEKLMKDVVRTILGESLVRLGGNIPDVIEKIKVMYTPKKLTPYSKTLRKFIPFSENAVPFVKERRFTFANPISKDDLATIIKLNVYVRTEFRNFPGNLIDVIKRQFGFEQLFDMIISHIRYPHERYTKDGNKWYESVLSELQHTFKFKLS